jgi:hypothetical protein
MDLEALLEGGLAAPVANGPVSADQRNVVSAGSLTALGLAMQRLGWSPRDLYVAAAAYGTIGDEDDVRLHLINGDHLGPYERIVVTVTLNDALMDRGDQFRVPSA